jgi:NADPH-dependent F420 reductase
VLTVIGGTGALGSGLARRLAQAGYPVIIGSRDAAKAKDTAADIEVAEGDTLPQGLSNAEAAAAANIIILAVPFAAQAEIAAQIKPHTGRKLVIDTTVPLVPPRLTRVQLPVSDSAAISLREHLGEGVRIVSAFHNIPARKMRGSGPVDCDVLVFGDDPADRQTTIALVEAAGMRGPLVNSTAAEALTSVLIGIGQIYKVDGAGIRITGLD